MMDLLSNGDALCGAGTSADLLMMLLGLADVCLTVEVLVVGKRVVGDVAGGVDRCQTRGIVLGAGARF